MKTENKIYVEKLDDGSYHVVFSRKLKDIIKDFFRGETIITLNPEEAKVLSNVLYTPKKKPAYTKPKKTIPPSPPCE